MCLSVYAYGKRGQPSSPPRGYGLDAPAQQRWTKTNNRDFKLVIARITHIASLPEPPDFPQRLDEGPPESDRSGTVGGFHEYAEVS